MAIRKDITIGTEPISLEVLLVDEDIVKYPEFMQYLYQKKLLSAQNLTKSEGLDIEIETWTYKEKQATTQLANKDSYE